MAFLYEKLETLREFSSVEKIPGIITNNINSNFKLRPYQINAFENFISYFKNEKLCSKPVQTLFHMATGSGKTMIMAGLIIYLYKCGYRNFLFFVNTSNILQKTKENFLNKSSNKYLFSDEILIEGEKVKIKEVLNFQDTDKDSINICFTTTQGLHSDMWFIKENSISFNDFSDDKIVLISDEAHHLNSDTKRKNKEEQENTKTWEYTIKKILQTFSENVLLEFTATCDLENPLIKSEYEDKIIFNYPLWKFREDKYSKEIKTLRSDSEIDIRSIQALILSQYRYKLFQTNKLNIKPVILFKSRLIKENQENMEHIIEMIKEITGEKLKIILEQSSSEIIKEAHNYFLKNNIGYSQLSQELKEDFSENHFISANDNKDIEKKQILLNSLEDEKNPYRAVFAVDKLNEGWDVLNLFDIVRLYETRDGKKNGMPGKTTMKEAQLIGRGARYCPFKTKENQEKYKRKYDNDLGNPLRVCEELYYHCWNEPRYISELKNALREIGIDLDKSITRNHLIKEKFKKDDIYKNGIVFLNKRILKSKVEGKGLICNKEYSISLLTGESKEDIIFSNKNNSKDFVTTLIVKKTISEIARINYAIVQKALCKFPIFKFSNLKNYFPDLNSTREFIMSLDYLGDVTMVIKSKYKDLSLETLRFVCEKVLGQISNSILEIEEVYVGTKEFYPKYLHEIFQDKLVNYNDPHDGGLGISQNDTSVSSDWKIDLSKEDWYVFEDNYGTSEEKAFVAYFKIYIDELKNKYDKVYLLRNERQLAIYSFDKGERFEPDYILLLYINKEKGYEQLQIFIEPKGNHLIEKDKWKEEFLLELKEKSLPFRIFVDDNNYKIWGFHFFNKEKRLSEFRKDIKLL